VLLLETALPLTSGALTTPPPQAMRPRACGTAAAENGGKVYQNAGEFRPLFEQLFASCEYLWVYAASAAGYLPFDEQRQSVADAVHAEMATLYPKWFLVRQSLDLCGARQAVTRLTFYVAENWYKHGDVVTFYLDGLRFSRQVAPEIRGVSVEPLVLGKGDPALAVACSLVGECAAPGVEAEFTLSATGAATPARTARQAVRAGRSLSQRFETAGLAPGTYVARVRLLRNGEPLDQSETELAVVDE
jgi:hypothetical protein